MAKKTSNRIVSAYDFDGNIVGVYDSIKIAAETLGISYGMVWRCLNGEKRSAKGYTFEYSDGY